MLPTAIIIDFCSSWISQWKAEDILYHKVWSLLGKISWTIGLRECGTGCLDGMGNEERVRTSSFDLDLSRGVVNIVVTTMNSGSLGLKLDMNCNLLGLRLDLLLICCRLKWWPMKKRSFNSIFRPNRKRNWTVSWSPRRENINSVRSSWKR